MKPVLDSMTDMVVSALSGQAKEFYDREFTFFSNVTSISGKLKPFIKKTKPEKKAKIDEEMAKIHVDVGVYLPSNPDGIVVDIDKKSGRPLQSHAKVSNTNDSPAPHYDQPSTGTLHGDVQSSKDPYRYCWGRR